jgi:hypothetical protein
MAIENGLQRRSGVAAIVAVPRSVVALGFVSLFMDISSEIIHGLLPVFLVAVLGASALSVGVIEGIAEATSQVTKLFAGVFSDWIGKRKQLILAGYGLAALTKPLFPLASGGHRIRNVQPHNRGLTPARQHSCRLPMDGVWFCGDPLLRGERSPGSLCLEYCPGKLTLQQRPIYYTRNRPFIRFSL